MFSKLVDADQGSHPFCLILLQSSLLHRLSGHESEQTPGDSEGQGSLVCCSLWGHKELDMTGRITAAQGLGPWVGGKNYHHKLGMGPMEAGLKPLTNALIH